MLVVLSLTGRVSRRGVLVVSLACILGVGAFAPSYRVITNVLRYDAIMTRCGSGDSARVRETGLDWRWSRLAYDCVYFDFNGREIGRKPAPEKIEA